MPVALTVEPMNQRLTPYHRCTARHSAPLVGGNAVVGRLVNGLRATHHTQLPQQGAGVRAAAAVAAWVPRRGSGLWLHWRRYAANGPAGVGAYNAPMPGAQDLPPHQRDAGVAASTPIFMLGIGQTCFG